MRAGSCNKYRLIIHSYSCWCTFPTTSGAVTRIFLTKYLYKTLMLHIHYMGSATKRNRRRARREHQVDPVRRRTPKSPSGQKRRTPKSPKEDTEGGHRRRTPKEPSGQKRTLHEPSGRKNRPYTRLAPCGATVWGHVGHGPETRQWDEWDQNVVRKTPVR